MLDFLLNYWLEFLLSAIATGLTILCKKIWNLYKKEKETQKNLERNEFYQSLQESIKNSCEISRQEEAKLQTQINAITAGVLSIQGRQFKQECREFLRADREFTVDEYEALKNEYDVYKGLKGNHDGDTLIHLVDIKASQILTDNKP